MAYVIEKVFGPPNTNGWQCNMKQFSKNFLLVNVSASMCLAISFNMFSTRKVNLLQRLMLLQDVRIYLLNHIDDLYLM